MRRAMYQAIDIETMKTKLMNGLERAHRRADAVAAGLGLQRPRDRGAAALRPEAARKLMAEAGYADGFEVTPDCPNNRYINDEEICIALAGMWAQLKIKAKVNAQLRATYFPKPRRTPACTCSAGRRHHRRRDTTPKLQPRREGRGLLELRRREERRSTRWPRNPASSPMRRSAKA